MYSCGRVRVSARLTISQAFGNISRLRPCKSRWVTSRCGCGAEPLTSSLSITSHPFPEQSRGVQTQIMSVKYVALHFYLSLSSSRRVARIVMDSGEGMWDKRVVADWDGHGSKMKEKLAAFHNLLPHGWDEHVSTIVWETGTRHGEVQCLERVFKRKKLSNSKSYVLAVGSEDKACSDLGRPGRCWKLQQKLSKTKVCGPTVLFRSVRCIP